MNPKMPLAEVYAREILYMPWGKTIERVIEVLIQSIPRHGKVLDVACGAGMLLGALCRERPDVELVGVDKDLNYIKYARRTHPKKISFIHDDALVWDPKGHFDAVVCTAGIHHIEWSMQEEFICRMGSWTMSGGLLVSADPCIGDYDGVQEWRLAVARLGYEYLAATIRNGATDEVIQAAIWLIENDVFARGEWKVSAHRYRQIFHTCFFRACVEVEKIWPSDGDSEGYGDYVVVVRA